MVFSLNPSDKTFVELQIGNYPWWNNLKDNNNISIQIRKNNKIDVYYNGGAILGELVYNDQKKAFSARIHNKYIPLKKDNGYKSLTLNNNDVKITSSFEPMGFSNFESEKLKLIMSRVNKHYGSDSEKAIQFGLFKKDDYLIDAEFQYLSGDSSDSRIDLVRLDVASKKIVFIEMKTIKDPRLFSDPDKDKKNIFHQLKKYHEFANTNEKDLLDYYKKVLQIKVNLGIAKPKIRDLSLDGWQIEPRPLLAFGDCNQNWTNKNADNIDKKIMGVAYGAYYFGRSKPSLDLAPETNQNRHVF